MRPGRRLEGMAAEPSRARRPSLVVGRGLGSVPRRRPRRLRQSHCGRCVLAARPGLEFAAAGARRSAAVRPEPCGNPGRTLDFPGA